MSHGASSDSQSQQGQGEPQNDPQQGGQQQSQQGQGQGEPQGEPQQTGQSQGQGDEGQSRAMSLTQEQLDAIISDRVSREQRKYEKQLEDERAKAGKNETEKLTIERDRAVEERDQVRSDSGQRIARSEAKVTAVTEGARSDRVDAVVGNADLSAAVDDNGEPDPTKIQAAVQKVLADYPEWKAGAVASKSGGEMKGSGESEPTLDDFKAMSMTNRALLHQRDPEVYRKLSQAEIEGRSA